MSHPCWRTFAARFIAVGAMLVAALACQAATSACPGGASRFADDAAVVDVRNHGALGDGVHDDTAAVLAAIRASGSDTGHEFWRNRIVYFPAGTYRVSDTLSRRAAQGRHDSGLC